MLFSTAMPPSTPRFPSFVRGAFLGAIALSVSVVAFGCKRSEPPPDYLKTQRDAMERAKEVGKTMQKSVDEEGKKADEEGR